MYTGVFQHITLVLHFQVPCRIISPLPYMGMYPVNVWEIYRI